MIRLDENALICDLAETYHILDYKRLPAMLAASLAVGLHESSRIKRKLNGIKVAPETLLLAAAVDYLALLVWSKTKDAAKGKNKPKSIMAQMFAESTPKEISAFDSGKDFEVAREKILSKLKAGKIWLRNSVKHMSKSSRLQKESAAPYPEH